MLKVSQIAVLAAGLAILPAVLGHADQLALNIETGLWEMTSTPHLSGDIPDNLTADQRAKLEAAMGKTMAPRRYRECMTPEKLQHAFDQPPTPAAKCQRTVLVNSATEMQMRVYCTDAQGTHQMSVHVQAPGPEAISGAMTLVSTRNGKTFTILNNIEGKRVASDCGSVTNIEPIN